VDVLVNLLIQDLTYSSYDSCSYSCGFSTFRDDTINGLWYDFYFYRQRRARVTVNFGLDVGRCRTYRDFFALAIDDVTAIGVLFQDGHY